MGRSLELAGAVCLVWLVGCGDIEPELAPIQRDPAPSTSEPSTVPAAVQRSAPLKGFFSTGNFATVTVPSDAGGTEPLSISSLKVRVEVVGRMVRTEVSQVFRNHTNRRTEGSYEFTLPAGAAISRLRMDVEGKMMEGELVERERARKIYENIVNSRKDPALLEWQGGERFKTQIFPIEAKADKTVILTYEQLLPSARGAVSYRYSMPNLEGQPGGSAIGAFDFALHAEDAEGLTVSGYPARVSQRQPGGSVEFNALRFLPVGPLEITFHATGTDNAASWRAERKGESFFMVDFLPELPPRQTDAPQHLVLALDTSAGLGQVELDRAIEVVREIWRSTPEDALKQIVYGDHRITACSQGDLTCLEGLGAGGGTDLEALLSRAVTIATAQAGRSSVVLLSDGVASLGELDADLIQERVSKGAENRPISIHTLAIGHAPDEAFLAQLASRGGGHSARMTPGDTPQTTADALIGRLQEPLLTGVTVQAVEGEVEGLVPHRAINLARGERVAVMGRIDGGRAVLQISGTYEGQTLSWRVEPQAGKAVENKLLVGFWARSVIEEMQDKAIPRDKIVATSLEYGVMSRYTSFLVLENDAAYKRFKVERRKEIARKEAAQRAQAVQALRKSNEDLKTALGEEGRFGDPDKDMSNVMLPKVDGEMVDKIDVKNLGINEALGSNFNGAGPLKNIFGNVDDFDAKMRVAMSGEGNSLVVGQGSGGMGVRGTGRGGGGDGFGRIHGLGKVDTGGGKGVSGKIGGRGKARIKAQLEQGEPVMGASCAESKVRLVVRRDSGALKYCYAKEIQLNPMLSGKVNLNWTVGLDGTVLKAYVSSSSLNNKKAEACMVRVIKRWHFKPRKGGNCAVSFPFTFSNDNPNQPHVRKAQLKETLAVAESGNASTGDLDYLMTLVRTHDERQQVVPHIIRHCKNPDSDEATCRRWLEALKDHETIQNFRVSFEKLRFDALKNARRQDIANPDLIIKIASVLRDQGQPEAAERALSELVEFTPHDYAARTRYANELIKGGEVVGGCDQFAAAVQLNPRQRDTFKDMMALRRHHPQFADTLRRCIVDGVSSLPVTRSISLVLTWEDPIADVDLHVHEVGGELVYHGDRESEIGGLLYYDITDGFGPEIYVLGSGPKGEYRLSLVYYAGKRRALKGTLTILRNAGAPDETREDRPFTLSTPNSNVKIPIGTFSL